MAQTPNLRRAALAYAGYSCRIFPVIAQGKNPLTANGYHDASLDADEITAWWDRWPDANIGLACGPSGYIALDVDPHKLDDAGRAFLAALEADCPTATQDTPTGGWHYLYMLPPDVALSNSAGDLPPGIDVRVNGYILLAPSVVTYHGEDAAVKGVPDGHTGRYAWREGYRPNEFPPAPLPDMVLDLLKRKPAPQPIQPPPVPTAHSNGSNGSSRYVTVALERELDLLARAHQGERNNQLNKGAFSMGQFVGAGELDENEAGDKLLTVALAIGLDEREARATIRSGLTAGAASPRGVPDEPVVIWPVPNGASAPEHKNGATAKRTPFVEMAHNTDMGNAKRMHAAVQDKVFYVPPFDRWYLWSGTHWQEDETFEIVKIAKRVVLSIYAEAAQIEDEESRKQTLKWAAKSEQRQRIEAMVALLRSEPGIARKPDTLDQHPLLLPCRNGTLDLATGELLAPDPSHLLTKCLPVAYDPDAECPTWERFLNRIMDGNLELIAFVQRLIGHALTGDATGKYMVFMYGPKGNNGKSTLVETVMRLLGPYAIKSPTEMVMAKSYRGGGIPNDIARLRGVRFTVTNEVDEGATLSESVVKDLTGYDTLTARFMRAEFFDFTPTHKLWIYGNHKPEIRGTDAAIWDRVKLIPFDVEIPKEERDPDMPAKLSAELPGILAWAVRGNLLWQRRGISAPSIVAAATGEYRTEQDIIGQFITECCDLDGTAQIGASALYQVYEAWSKQNGVRPESGTKFGSDLARRGFSTARSRAGNMRRGLKLNAAGEGLRPAPPVHWADRD